MRINKKTYPVFHILKDGGCMLFGSDVGVIKESVIVQAMEIVKEHARTKIYYVAKPFAELACFNNYDRLMGVWRELLNEAKANNFTRGEWDYIDEKAIFICDDRVVYLHVSTSPMRYSYVEFKKTGELMACYFPTIENGKVIFVDWCTVNMPLEFQPYSLAQMQNYICILLLKKYAEVETKILPPNTKVRHMGCKYLNETSQPITYLDSKWFTTLVKSEGFKVGGHFRLQPKKKDGKWTKELIWISDFMKTGYTAKARKLSAV